MAITFVGYSYKAVLSGYGEIGEKLWTTQDTQYGQFHRRYWQHIENVLIADVVQQILRKIHVNVVAIYIW